VTESKPEAKADVANVLNTSLGDLLVAGLVRNPEDAGRFIAAALRSTGRATAKAREADAGVQPDPRPGVKAKTPPDSAPKAVRLTSGGA
jgi:hypothetical protein